MFKWANFRKHIRQNKVTTLYNTKAGITEFEYITPANIYASKTRHGFHTNLVHIDRGYNDFSNLNTINRIGDFFVVRVKIKVRIKLKTWKRRLSKGVVSDVIGYFMVRTVRVTSKNLENSSLRILKTIHDTRYIFLTNNLDASTKLISPFYRNKWSVELFQMDKMTPQD